MPALAKVELQVLGQGGFVFVVSGWLRFFFQAEDGIRDLYVTGVQTCALPISGREKQFTGLLPPGLRMDVSESELRGKDDGVTNRLERLKLLGNGQDPRVTKWLGRDRKSVV